jgi:hypothetical protein
MSNAGAASLAALIPARAAASRRNGARSRGPKTPEGKARSARNALKHGLCAQRFLALGDEDLAAFDALEAALTAELAPQGALQAVLVRRIVAATWRLERAERLEGEIFAQNSRGTTSFGLAMIRDCNGPRAFDTLLRYRGGTLAELWRALRTLKALQAEAAAQTPQREAAGALSEGEAEMPSKPERRTNPHDSVPAPLPAPTPAPAASEPAPAPVAAPARPAPQRIEPKRRTNPGESPPSMPREIVRGVAALLATAAPLGRGDALRAALLPEGYSSTRSSR